MAIIEGTALVGCDVGNKGGIAIFDVDCFDAEQSEYKPTLIKLDDVSKYVANAAFTELTMYNNIVFFIEDVHSIFGMSASTNFKFGFNKGWLAGLADGFGAEIHYVRPKVWQKSLGVTKKGKEIKKEVATLIKERCDTSAAYGPKGGLHDGLSDAIAIGLYGLTEGRSKWTET